MPYRHKIARDVTSSLVTAVCLFHADQAAAAEDPFALATSTSDFSGLDLQASNDDVIESFESAKPPEYNAFTQILVNGQPKKRLVKIKTRGDSILIHSGDAAYAGLIPIGTGEEYISLDTIKGVQWNFDAQRNQLSVDLPRNSDGRNAIDFADLRNSSGNLSTPLTALVVDYDMGVSADRRGLTAAGLVSARLSRDQISIESDFRFSTRKDIGTSGITRLNTAVTYFDQGKMIRATAGDFVSVTPTLGRAVRMAGVQLTTDFALRPDLVTFPLPDFTGSVAVPSGLDLIINDKRFRSADVDRGEFTLKNIPIPVGRNEIGVVVKDSLGRERLETVQYYSARSLLARGLSKSAINVGAIRRNFGRKSNDYGEWAISAFHRRGLTNGFTGEFSGEASPGFFNGGAGASFALGKAGLFSAGVNVSRSRFGVGQERSGRSIAVSYESVGRDVSVRFGAVRVSDGYDDLASAAGDSPPKSLLSASLNFDLRSLGNFSVTALRQEPQKRRIDLGEPKRADVVTASYRKSFGNGLNLFADLSHRYNGQKSTSVLFGISMSFGGRGNAQASVVRQRGKYEVQGGLYRPDRLPGDWGYALQAGTGQIDRVDATVSHRASWGRVEARGEVVDGRAAGRLSARGSLLIADGDLFAAENLSGGFALIRSNKVAGVAVERENRSIGKTNGKGKLLLTGIAPFIPTKVGLNPDTLPPELLARKLSDMIVVGPRSGTVIDLEIGEYAPQLLQVSQMNGKLIEPGTVAKAMPSGSEYIVGFDGILEIDRQLGDTELQVKRGVNETCFFDIEKLAEDDVSPIEIQCNATIRTMALGGLNR